MVEVSIYFVIHNNVCLILYFYNRIANTLDSVTNFLDNHLKDPIEIVTFMYKESILTLHNLLRNYFGKYLD